MNQLKQFSRTFASTRVVRYKDNSEAELQEYLKKMPKYKKVRDNMKRFQKDDGVPIYLKAGLRDRLSLYAIITATVTGFCYSQYMNIHNFWIKPIWYCETQEDD